LRVRRAGDKEDLQREQRHAPEAWHADTHWITSSARARTAAVDAALILFFTTRRLARLRSQSHSITR